MHLILFLHFILLSKFSLATECNDLLKMSSEYLGEDIGQSSKFGTAVVARLSNEMELGAYEVSTDDSGRLLNSLGFLIDTTEMEFTDRANHKTRAIFIIDEKSRLYISKVKEFKKFHHSTLSNGRPVYLAGEIEVRDGVVTYLNNKSGHYQSGTETMLNGVSMLLDSTIDLSKANIFVLSSSIDKAQWQRFIQLGFSLKRVNFGSLD